MNNRITKAIDIFLDAINEGTLAKGNCCACAVGNLVAHGMNGKISRLENSFNCNVKNNGLELLSLVASNVVCTNCSGCANCMQKKRRM